MFGGGMRQAGIIAAGGIFALENHIERMADDHARARKLAQKIGNMDGFDVDISTVETNMVYITTHHLASEVIESLSKKGIDALDLGPNMLRLVTHLHITDEDIERTIDAFATL